MDRSPQNISIVIPCFNEEECIKVLYDALCPVTDKLSFPYDLIFVDDGSTDGTLEIISLLAEQDPHVRWLSFSRNFGHQKALKAGLDYAKGEVVITMDADMQHPSSLIPVMLSRVILFMLGIIGEYLGKMFMQCKNRPEYVVQSENR